MQQIALIEERYRADNAGYLSSGTSLWSQTGGDPSGTYFTYSVLATAASTTSSGTTPATYTIKAVGSGMQLRDRSNGTSCTTLYYAFGQDTGVDSACSLTGTDVTANGKVTKCPLDCWSK